MISTGILVAATALAGGTASQGLDVHIDSTRYTTRHVYPGGYALAPKDYRLLVVRYHVQNHASNPLQYNRESISFSVLADNDRITAGFAPLRMTGEGLDEIRPGESRSDETWLEVPYDAKAPKLGIRVNGQDQTYPLNAAKADPGPWRETPDVLPVPKGKSVPLGPWDVAVNRFFRTPKSPSYNMAIQADETALVAEIEFHNALPETVNVTAQSLTTELVDADGTALRTHGRIFEESKDAYLDRNLGPGGRVHARIAFEVPATFHTATLRLTDPSTGRAVTVGL